MQDEDMVGLCDDLRAERDALSDLCAGLDGADWALPTAFFGWSAWDEVAHLALLDGAALAAAEGGGFDALAAALRARRAAGAEISGIAREDLGHLDGPALLAHWRAVNDRLCDALARRAQRDRMPWFGPPMSARSFATARLMETWAHGQDVFDLFGRRREPTARLRHIAHLGVTTCEWSFRNRGLAIRGPVPHVDLAAPDGTRWTWCEPQPGNAVVGDAEEFCLVVTQRRHVDDTGLRHTGTASAWLVIAQCFAGPPADGPAPGARRRAPSPGSDDAVA